MCIVILVVFMYAYLISFVCIRVFMFVFVVAFTWVCVDIYACIYVCVCIIEFSGLLWMRSRLRVLLCLCMYVCIRVYKCGCMCSCVCVICVRVRRCICVCVCGCTYVCRGMRCYCYVCACVCVCVCVGVLCGWTCVYARVDVVVFVHTCCARLLRVRMRLCFVVCVLSLICWCYRCVRGRCGYVYRDYVRMCGNGICGVVCMGVSVRVCVNMSV